MSRAAAIIDVDGTLIDSNYQHAIAWFRAFRDDGITVPIWRIHRHIGMGGDQLVGAVAGEEAERDHGDSLRGGEGEHYRALVSEVRPFAGSGDLLSGLAARGCPVVLASSAREDEIRHYVDLLGAEDDIDGYTTSDDVDRTKPDPDLVHAALEKVTADEAVMIGDSTWDIEAARRAGLDTLAVLTGGFSRAELEEAGALTVYESVAHLAADLDSTPFGDADA